jgi:hypothetical protein
MIVPVFATVPICEGQFDTTIKELYQRCESDIIRTFSLKTIHITTNYGLLDARTIMESRPKQLWLEMEKG